MEIEIDDEVVGHGRYDHFREDLVAAGAGSGRHGFGVLIGTNWNDGLAHEIRVRAAGTDLEIDNSPLNTVVGGEQAVTRMSAPRPGPFAADTVRAREGSYDALRRRAERRGSVAIVAIHQRVPTRSSALDGFMRALDANGSAVLVVDTTEGGAPVVPDTAGALTAAPAPSTAPRAKSATSESAATAIPATATAFASEATIRTRRVSCPPTIRPAGPASAASGPQRQMKSAETAAGVPATAATWTASSTHSAMSPAAETAVAPASSGMSRRLGIAPMTAAAAGSFRSAEPFAPHA